MIDPTPHPASSAASASTTPSSWLERMRARLKAFLSRRAQEEAIREAIEEIIDQPDGESGTGAGAATADRELLTNLLNARDRTAADIMIPRADIFAAEEGTSLKKLAALMSESGHSRVPVYRGTLDDVIGFVHIKDITAVIVNDRSAQPKDILRKLLFIPPGMPVTRLLLQMRQKRRHMALVVDEFGGVDGLVTIEDVVEEIVGEIDDEYDAPDDTTRLQRKQDGSVVVDARMPIDDFEEAVGRLFSDSERQDADTLAGLIFALTGHIPARGEKIRHSSGTIFEILDADTRRIKRLRVTHLPTPAEAETAPEPAHD